VDIIMHVHRLPGPGETTIAAKPSASIAVGGKVRPALTLQAAHKSAT
jgi:hypothetical protein